LNSVGDGSHHRLGIQTVNVHNETAGCLLCRYFGVRQASSELGKTKLQRSRVQREGDENMLGIIAAVLIVLWLLGFFAFHVTAGFIHVALVVGLILLVLHFMRGSRASA
jgi:hypothetical protein